MRKFYTAGLPVLLLILSGLAHASTGELYGYGSRASAMGNTMLGGVSDGFATFYNPAANSSHPGLHVSFATSFEHPTFTDIKGVVINNSSTSSATSSVTGDVDTTSYLDHLGQAIAVSFNLGEKWKNFTIGLTAFMPLARVAYLDTSDPFLPDYFSYRSRTQRPQIYASISAAPMKHLQLAMGLAFATNLSAVNNATITSASGMVSQQRFASTIKPGVAPYFSFFANPDILEFGGAVRMANKYKVSIDTNAHTHLLSTTNDLPLVINSSSTIFYDPLEFDFGAGVHVTPETFITAEVDWLQYAAFESPTLTVTDLGSGPKLQPSVSSLPTTQNIIIPKFAVERVFDNVTVRAGYMYRPSPVKDNSGIGNLVDPSRHSLTAGVGFDLKKIGVTDKEINMDLHAQYHLFVTQHINKSGGNENGDLSQSKIGSPGYDIGGHIIGAGLSLTMAF